MGRDRKTTGETYRQDAGFEIRTQFFAPPAEFEGCFTSFYHLELEVADGGVLRDFLQPEWANIRFFCGATPWSRMHGGEAISGSDFTATGPSSHPVEFELGSTRMWGIGFLPLGWGHFIAADARSLANQLVDGRTHPVFSSFAGLRDSLCNPDLDVEAQYQAIVDHMRASMRPLRDASKIRKVHEGLLDPDLVPVTDLAERAGMAVRSLERLCRRYFGFPPKLLLRRQRFMRSLVTFMLEGATHWTEAMDNHYHDQSQFTREFRQFMGMNPSDYAALDHPILESFMAARARTWGSPVQTLDKPG